MAGVSLDVTVEDREVRQMLAALREKVGNLRPVMATIGEIVVESVQSNFEQHRSPDGAPWAPLSPSYAQWRSAKKGRNSSDILILNRILMGSIHAQPASDQVTVGTNIVYAAIHQFGGRAGRRRAADIPARPFLGVRREDWAEIADVLHRHLERA